MPRKPPRSTEERLARTQKSMTPGTLGGRVAAAAPMSLDVTRLDPRLRTQKRPAPGAAGGNLLGVVDFVASETLTSNGSAHGFSAAMTRTAHAGTVDAANYDTGGHGFALNTAAARTVFAVAVGMNISTAGMTSGDVATVRVNWPAIVTCDFTFAVPVVGGFFTALQSCWMPLDSFTVQDVGSFYFTCAQSSARTATATVTVAVSQFSWPA